MGKNISYQTKRYNKLLRVTTLVAAVAVVLLLIICWMLFDRLSKVPEATDPAAETTTVPSTSDEPMGLAVDETEPTHKDTIPETTEHPEPDTYIPPENSYRDPVVTPPPANTTPPETTTPPQTTVPPETDCPPMPDVDPDDDSLPDDDPPPSSTEGTEPKSEEENNDVKDDIYDFED